ncbi:hypothetical protein [Deinococcus roseus]|uniref:Water stress and hypersensitive response domain-containing protein n=1 Tax=Deinococcus roseus TaxID=392414 RepID=A0ABQ2DIG9_9DEIO|nr:hypothetical protein [Deinococcus roseus]GGJ56782.1 hypothetical protein GCM10008938_48670 [Deinococcus roseus]
MIRLHFWPLLALLTCCTPSPPGLTRIPDFQVLQSQVTDLHHALEVQVTVQVHNPNPFPITLKNVSGQWIVDGINSLQGTLPDLQVPASSESTPTFKTQVPKPSNFNPSRTHTFRFDGLYLLVSGTQQAAIQEYTLFQGTFKTIEHQH